jgi:hypothetical protein
MKLIPDKKGLIQFETEAKSNRTVDSPRRRYAGRPSLRQAAKRGKTFFFKPLFPPLAERGWSSEAMTG